MTQGREEMQLKYDDNWALMMSAAKQYYQLGLTQDVIAKNLFISKSTVSRLVKKSVEMGYIEFKVNSFGEIDEMLQLELMDAFGIESFVLPTYVDSYEVRLNDVCAFAAKDIFSQVEDGEVIGVPWGRTIEYLAANINEPDNRYTDLTICMLNGFVNGSIRSMRAIHIIERLSTMLNAAGYVMPCPLLVETPEVKTTMLSDPSIRKAYELAISADTVIISVGPCDMQNTYLTDLGEDAAKHLRQFNGAGNFAGRTYDIDGLEFHTDLYPRLMSLPIQDLARKKKRICIAVGEYKAKALLGLLRGRIINRLYTDAGTAKAILREQKSLPVRKGRIRNAAN